MSLSMPQERCSVTLVQNRLDEAFSQEHIVAIAKGDRCSRLPCVS